MVVVRVRVGGGERRIRSVRGGTLTSWGVGGVWGKCAGEVLRI